LHLFPTLCEPTTTLWTGQPPIVEPSDGRGAMMPKRRHTRNHNKAKAINAERRLNETHCATVSELAAPDERRRTPAPRSNDPPPF
jgi:hypothetical protein